LEEKPARVTTKLYAASDAFAGLFFNLRRDGLVFQAPHEPQVLDERQAVL
jgi:hypothetical protein